ncbi:MAG: disulfide bond formation protein B [Alphaproteobacteria bacterium]|nr:disulfide bond formation protein B [Alphaproteobacteria bacterium]
MSGFLENMLTRPSAVLGIVAGVSAFSLAATLASEVFLGLEPCVLCIYQRIPFVLALVVSLVFLFYRRTGKADVKPRMAALGLCALLFFGNTLTAFYHTGIERHWWRSAVEGCAVPSLARDPQSLLENLLSAPTARCDEIPWADPVLGLSMANYNALLCFALFVLCVAALTAYRPPSSGKS